MIEKFNFPHECLAMKIQYEQTSMIFFQLTLWKNSCSIAKLFLSNQRLSKDAEWMKIVHISLFCFS